MGRVSYNRLKPGTKRCTLEFFFFESLSKERLQEGGGGGEGKCFLKIKKKHPLLDCKA